MAILWIIASYVLGSLPCGYLISIFSGKNVLEIGWRKTSGSNVFKNVGKWQGVLTGLLDVGKGYLAVFIAQRLGFGSEVQVLSGVAAVTGHNWSIFLKFAGGRGIGTFIGVFLALSPQVLLYSVIPLVAIAIAWDAAVGTLVFLAAAIYLASYFGQFETAGHYTLISLIPILIKRLSPVGEVRSFILFGKRLLFDNDEGPRNLRIKRMSKVVTAPSKAGWKVAKQGANITKNGVVAVKKYILGAEEKKVVRLEVEDFKRMMIAASKMIVLHQEEINRINVFPVADKDTGYNLAATLLGVEGTVSRKTYPNFRELTQDMKDAAMINTRGNAGMICTGYFVEVLDRIKHLETIDAFHLALALRRGIKAARLSIAEPVEGTILDTIKVAGQKAYETAKIRNEKNIIKVLEEAHKVSLVALEETKEKLAVLKENDVVDAGALGYVKILEAWIKTLKGETIEIKTEEAVQFLQPKAEEELKYRYEVIATFKKREEDSLSQLKEELSSTGDSLELIEVEDKVKLHIHTDKPEEIVSKIKAFSEIDYRIEDMQGEVKKLEKKPLGLVVDAIADLPEDFLKKYNIEEVPFTTRFPEGEIIKSKEDIYPKMKEALKTGRPLPATSAPSFKDFISTYNKAFEKFKKILVITVSAKLSGAYSSARIARSAFKKPKKLNIYVFDSFTGEVAEGLVCWRTQELIDRGKTMEEIIEELKVFCPKVTLLAAVDDYKYIIHGGRVKLPRSLAGPIALIQKTGIRPIIILKKGKIRLSGIRFGKDIAKLLAKEVNKLGKRKRIKVAIAHADNPEAASKLKKELGSIPGVELLFVSSVSPVVGTHTGPGALMVALYPVDSQG